MGPYSIGLIVVCLMDQAEQTVEVFTYSKQMSVQLSQTSVLRRQSICEFVEIEIRPLLTKIDVVFSFSPIVLCETVKMAKGRQKNFNAVLLQMVFACMCYF